MIKSIKLKCTNQIFIKFKCMNKVLQYVGEVKLLSNIKVSSKTTICHKEVT